MPTPVRRKLHRILGVGRMENHGEPDTFEWVPEGIPALEHVCEVVGPWLGTVKRNQARAAMSAFSRRARMKGSGTHSKRATSTTACADGETGRCTAAVMRVRG